MADYHRELRKDKALLDYVFDWAANTNGDATETDWLVSGDAIATKSVTVESGLAKQSDTLINTNTAVRVWLNAQSSELGTYLVTCDIVTDDGREDSRTLEVEVI